MTNQRTYEENESTMGLDAVSEPDPRKAGILARINGLQVGDVDIELADLEVLELRERRPGMPHAYWNRALLNKLIDAARRRLESLEELAEREHTEGQAVEGVDSFGHRLGHLLRRLTGNVVEDQMIAYLDGKRPAAAARASMLTRIVSAIVDRAEEIVSINRELGHDQYIAKLRSTKKIGLHRLRYELVFFSSDGQRLLTAWTTTDLATDRSWVSVSAWAGNTVPASGYFCVCRFVEGWSLYPIEAWTLYPI